MTLAIRSFLLAFYVCAQSAAESRTPVEVILPYCGTPPIDSTELKQALNVELSAAGFEIAAGEGTRVVIEYPECQADATDLKITIDFKVKSQTSASLHTRVLLSDVPQASRARTAAVAVAELVRVTRPPVLPITEAPSPAPSLTVPLLTSERLPPPLAVAVLEAAPHYGRLSVGASAQVAWLASGQGAFLGATGVVGFDVTTRWRSRLNLFLLRDSVETAFGPIEFTVYGGSFGWERLLCTRPVIALGPDLSIATVRAFGHSNLGVRENVQTLWFSSGGTRLALEVPLYKALRFTATANVGRVLTPALFTAGGKDATKFTGFQGGWSVGFSVQP